MQMSILNIGAAELQSSELRKMVSADRPHVILAAELVWEGPAPGIEAPGMEDETVISRSEFAFWTIEDSRGVVKTRTEVFDFTPVRVRNGKFVPEDDEGERGLHVSREDFSTCVCFEEAVDQWFANLSAHFFTELCSLYPWPGRKDGDE